LLDTSPEEEVSVKNSNAPPIPSAAVPEVNLLNLLTVTTVDVVAGSEVN